MKRLTALLRNINNRRVAGSGDPEITGIAFDSRAVREGFAFFALPGVHTDGHDYAAQAVTRGALAVIVSRELPAYSSSAVYLHVDDTRAALSAFSAAFYDEPSGKLCVVGVTGTDGKSTTVSLIHQLLEAAGEQAGFLSTVEFKAGAEVVKNPFRQSTPEANEVHGFLDEMRRNGKRYAVVEATSHGLSERTSRLRDVLFDVGVYTNVTHEHLEFHGSLEQYRSDKANLFRALDTTAAAGKRYEKILSSDRGGGDGAGGDRGEEPVLPFGIVNTGDPHHEYFASCTRRPAFRYGIDDRRADLSAVVLNGDLSGSTITITDSRRNLSFPARINIPGVFNVENALAALLCVSLLTGRSARELAPHLSSLQGVAGRQRPIVRGQPFSVLVDYAHTPGAFERLFPFVRSLTHGRLIAVFGSGGERDVAKRPLQGRLAAEHCETIYLTDEDPRLEDRMKILAEIEQGCRISGKTREIRTVPDRREAIRSAFRAARPGDAVLLLGKGHEASIIGPEGPRPWDEITIAEELLAELGYGI